MESLHQKISPVKKNTFIISSKNESANKQRNFKIFSTTFTLLPHQVLIFPIQYKTHIDPDQLAEMKIIDDKQIR